MIEKIKNYIFPLILLVSLLIFRNQIIHGLFWIILASVLIITSGIPKDNNYSKSSVIRITIISLMMYLLITYMSGLILGFGKSHYNFKFISIIKNISIPLIIVICKELTRFIFAKKCTYNVKPYIVLTIVYIILDILIEYLTHSFSGTEAIFLFMCSKVVPTIALQSLCSYITYKVSFVPALLIETAFGPVNYLLPIFPNMGNYLVAMVKLLYPFITFLYVRKILSINSKDKEERVSNISIGTIVTFVILFAIISLVSGLFKYQVVAIGSGSMEPVIYRGDAILLTKRNDYNNMEVGEVLAFKNNGVLITHRIIGIEKRKNNYIFKTKGDNNNDIDTFDVHEEDIVGTVNFKISYLGYPTIWVNEQFRK